MSSAATKYPSGAFIEDALFFVVSIIPLVYFFGENRLLLASVAHALSIPCAGIAHSPKIEKLQAFSLSLVSGLLLLVDAATVLLCACQLTQMQVCCDVLSSVGVGCMNRVEDFPVTIALLPVGLYNLTRGLERIVKLWGAASPAGKRGFATALLTTALSGYVALLALRGRQHAIVDVLTLAAVYALVTSCVGAADLYYGSTPATIAVFFASHVLVAFQAYLSLSKLTPGTFVGVAAAVFVLASFVTMPLTPVQDTWTSMYSLFAGGTALVVTVVVWDDLHPLSGSILVGYFTSCVGRSFLFRSDSFYAGLIFSIVFCVLDVCAIGLVYFYSFATAVFITMESIVGISFAVSVYTIATRWNEIRHVRVVAETIANPPLKFAAACDRIPGITDPGAEGLRLGEDVAIVVRADGFEPGEAFERINETIAASGFRYADPNACETSRARAAFLFGFRRGMGGHVAADVAQKVMAYQRLRLGVPKGGLTRDAVKTSRDESLDVAWTPGDGVGLQHILALRFQSLPKSASADGTREFLLREIKNRYVFRSARLGFVFASPIEKFDTHWNIVWS